MKEKISKIYNRAKELSFRYVGWIIAALFLVWIIFFDDFCLVDRFEKMSLLYELRENEKYYENENRKNKEQLEELMSGKEELEKFAREQYYMKEDDEDVFIVIIDE